MLAKLQKFLAEKFKAESKVTANNASVAIGGNVRDSSITIGIAAGDLEQQVTLPIRGQLDQIVDSLAKEKGIEEDALRSILARLEHFHNW
jgi:hypothetical protein